ncbi:ABC transporter permease [Rhodovarius crocodyli]|uniref:ABC transporter permease n=1 Tax=Rhodovarius crocodyli TaxID=1979269 RepID=A0A437MLZ9_9PROT|nr:ABC transporter permease [Rhodovarius crocodyli]RVT98652.1 ABC transporter permease [Rhodovarius crocodyli]
MSAALTGLRPEAAHRPRTRLRAVPTWLLIAPALLYMGVVFLLPLANTAWVSFSDPMPGLHNYIEVLTTPAYLRIYRNTTLMALLVTGICIVMAYPLALYIARAGGAVGAVLLAATGLSFWISFLVRTYAWTVILGSRGPVSQVARWMGYDPPPVLLFTSAASIIGMTHILLPFMVLSIYVVLARIDPVLLRAASGLGATRGQTFRQVVLPLSMPGIISGSLLVFVFCLGFYVTPALIGSPRDLMVASLIATQIEDLLAFGTASAMAMLLLGATLLMLAVYDRALGLANLMK